MQESRQQKGSVLVELAVVSAMLILLLAGIVDFTRCFGISQSVSQLSRELANVAYRECTSLPRLASDDQLTLQHCLQEHIAAVIFASQQGAGPLSRNLQVRLSVYEYDGTTVQRKGSAANGLEEKIDRRNPRFQRLVASNGIATVAEVALPITPFFGWLQPVFPEVLYEATLF